MHVNVHVTLVDATVVTYDVVAVAVNKEIAKRAPGPGGGRSETEPAPDLASPIWPIS